MTRPSSSWSRKYFLLACFCLVISASFRNLWKLPLAWSYIENDSYSMRSMGAGFRQHIVDVATTNASNPVDNASSSSDSLPSKSSTPRNKETSELAYFFLGIFTVQSEYQLREAVRKTFEFYQDPRVCAHGSLMPSGFAPPPHCRLMYTFVMGVTYAANGTDASNMKTQVVDSTTPLTTSAPPKGFNVSVEPLHDMTFLNIKENMNHGKTLTWFRYAARVMTIHNIDYAIKCDSDTGLRLHQFWPWVRQHLPPGGQAMYAGLLEWSFRAKTPYMLGQFYILSRDLAHAVSLLPLEQDGDPYIQHVEDVDTGYLLSKLTPPKPLIHLVGFPMVRGPMILPWKHGLKTPNKHQRFRSGLSLAIERKKGNATKTL